jgi:HEAT repeat protein
LNDIVDRLRKWSQDLLARWLPQWSGLGREPDDMSEEGALAALRDAVPHRRWQAARALGRNSQRSGQAIAALIECLSDPEPFVRWYAAEALAAQEAGHVFPALCLAVGDHDPTRRAGAAEALGRLGGEAACVELRRAVPDADPRVRVAAAQALGACADPTSLPVLLPMLKDRSPDVRAAAAAALGRIGDTGAAVSLASALAQPDQPVLVRRALAAALAKVPHPEVQATLLAALHDTDAQVRGYAIQALGHVGNETAWNDLMAMQRDNRRLLQGTVADEARRALVLLERRGRQVQAPHQPAAAP